MLHDNTPTTATTTNDNDEDTSSNHSSISSTSFGSSDVHDRSSYSSYHRSSATSATSNNSTTGGGINNTGSVGGREVYTGRDISRDYYPVGFSFSKKHSYIKEHIYFKIVILPSQEEGMQIKGIHSILIYNAHKYILDLD